MKVLGVVIDRRLTFHKHVSMVARLCNYQSQAIRHIRHLLTMELAQTLACSLILSRIDYGNAVLHGTPTGTIQKLQRVQNNAVRIVLQVSRRSHAKPLLHQLHWLPVQQRITHKLAVLTYKVRSTSTPVYIPLNHRTCLQPNFTFICHPAAGPTVHDKSLLYACFPVFSTVCLELAATNSSHQ